MEATVESVATASLGLLSWTALEVGARTVIADDSLSVDVHEAVPMATAQHAAIQNRFEFTTPV